MIKTFLQWHRTADVLPDDDILVLCSHDSDTYAGFMDGDSWRYADAIPSPTPQFWAHFPQGPEADMTDRAALKEAK